MRFMVLMLAAAMLPAGAATAVAQEGVVYGATYVEVAPGATSQAIALLKALGTASRKEDGNLRFQVVTGQLDNVSRIRQVRRDVARIKTILREQEIAAAEAIEAAAAAPTAPAAPDTPEEES